MILTPKVIQLQNEKLALNTSNHQPDEHLHPHTEARGAGKHHIVWLHGKKTDVHNDTVHISWLSAVSLGAQHANDVATCFVVSGR